MQYLFLFSYTIRRCRRTLAPWASAVHAPMQLRAGLPRGLVLPALLTHIPQPWGKPQGRDPHHTPNVSGRPSHQRHAFVTAPRRPRLGRGSYITTADQKAPARGEATSNTSTPLTTSMPLVPIDGVTPEITGVTVGPTHRPAFQRCLCRRHRGHSASRARLPRLLTVALVQSVSLPQSR